ncbi:MAG: phenylalanine--tRNA ligase subunit beta [Rhabdochlamydiaceae bacterium]
MKILLSWLRDYIQFDLSIDALSDTLMASGVEVIDAIKISPAFDHVVVAEVLAVEPHPKADRLKIAKVFDGLETRQIVCGASNCRVGIRTALAKIDASLPDKNGTSFRIKKSKIRDVESFGMLCGLDELGLSDTSDGIVEFSNDIDIGSDLKTFYQDVVLDLCFTPNMGHCMSLIGIARDLSAQLNILYKQPIVNFKENSEKAFEDCLSVNISEKKGLEQYNCRVLSDIKIAPSPEWLKKRLTQSGLRSVNNLVDITNYVLLETGQPLHAFDLDKIKNKTISVGNTPKNSDFFALDHKNYLIPDEAILINDEEKVLAIGGVIGGLSSSIDENTSSIVIEAAIFSQESIRKTSKSLQLRTEASQKFEKLVDPEATIYALNRACQLIQELCGAEIHRGLFEYRKEPYTLKKIKVSLSYINKILGTHLSLSEVVQFLERLEMIVDVQEEELMIKVPSYRNDITYPIDIVEEVAKIYGLKNITKHFSRHASGQQIEPSIYTFEQKVRSFLRQQGLFEFLTCDLISPAQSQIALDTGLDNSCLIKVLAPSSIDQSVLRPSLLPAFLDLARYNIDRQNIHLKGYEIGKIHTKENEDFKEALSLALMMYGSRHPYHFDSKPQLLDFYDLKGHIENFLSQFHTNAYSFKASSLKVFHPKRQAHIFLGDVMIGSMGQLHPELLQTSHIEKEIFFAELNLSSLSLLHKSDHKVSALPLFPCSERDWTFNLPINASLEKVLNGIKNAHFLYLEKSYLLDIYYPEDRKSKNVTIRFIYRRKDQTISYNEVEESHHNIMEFIQQTILTSPDFEVHI